jgi:hypothetical protein
MWQYRAGAILGFSYFYLQDRGLVCKYHVNNHKLFLFVEQGGIAENGEVIFYD